MWNQFVAGYQKVEKTLGSAKFAVLIIVIFALALTYGTFMESYHGTDFANRLVYKSLPFMGLQLLMFLSILVATLQRFPMKKHLYGFYVIHLGLMILFLGSYVTYDAGVDGNLTLAPNTPARDVMLNSDQLTIQFPKRGNEVTVELPYRAGSSVLNFDYESIVKILDFLPFAEESVEWVMDQMSDSTRLHSSQYQLANDNFSETIILSLHPRADFESTTQLGPLSVHYMPIVLAECFATPSYQGLLIWDARGGRCFAPIEKNLVSKKGLSGKNLLILKDGETELRFLPDLSPLPVNQDLKVVEDSPYRIFSRRLFQDKPHLFVFGTAVGYYDQEAKVWKVENFTGAPVALPWMGFKIALTKHYPSSYPLRVPVAVKPIQDNGQLIKGNLKAIRVEAAGEKFWVTSERAMSFEHPKEGQIIFQLGRKTLKLPFEITLDNFKMDTDPGTQNPASYESFVTLFKGDQGASKHHVFMNNPMKHESFTFYQASYFQTQQGPYGSVFSVNYDPGRFWKYLGSLLLVLGSLWHFVLRRKPSKKPLEESHA